MHQNRQPTRTPTLHRSFQILLLAAILWGCSSDDSPDAGDAGTSTAGSEAGADATGTDAAGNDAAGNDTTGAQAGTGELDGSWFLCRTMSIRFVFSGTGFEQYLAYYNTPDCSGPPIREEDLPSPDEPYVTGRFELLGEVTTDSGVTARQINMTSETLLGTPVTAATSVTQYNLVFQSSPDELVFGEFVRQSEDKRPTALDFERVYRRQ